MPTKASRIAVYLSSHGYGHCVRTGALLECLLEFADFKLEVTSPLPSDFWPESLLSRTHWDRRVCDPGVSQSDDVSVDRAATRAKIDEWLAGHEQAVAREAERLASGFDLVVGDVPPLAFAAAARAGVPSVAVANFSWDWIYSEMGFAEAGAVAASAYASAGVLLELEPAAPMPAFPERRQIGLLGRRPTRDRQLLRDTLGIARDSSLVLLSFRTTDERMLRLPEPSRAVIYMVPAGDHPWHRRDDVLVAPAELPYVDLVAAADVVVSKPGYGIVGDSAGCGTPLLVTERKGFPEDVVLERWIDGRDWTGKVGNATLAAGAWLPVLEGMLALERPEPSALPAGQAGARIIAELLG